MTLNTTHVRGKGGFNGGMTLKLGRCVRVRFLHMCAKFRGSTTYSCREKPDWGVFDLVPLDFASKFHLSYKMFKFLFLNNHVPNRRSVTADDWRQHLPQRYENDMHWPQCGMKGWSVYRFTCFVPIITSFTRQLRVFIFFIV